MWTHRWGQVSCCLLFLMFVQHELSYDSFHQRADRIYRVVDRLEWQNGEVDYLSMQPVEFANEAPKQVAGIEAASGFIKTSTGVRHEEREFETAVGLVHADFLNIFSFELLAGERESAIGDPLSVVIDGDLATRLYGLHQKEYQEAIGKTLTLDDVSERVFTVTGVMTPVPRNSSLHFEALASIDHHKGFLDQQRHQRRRFHLCTVAGGNKRLAGRVDFGATS